MWRLNDRDERSTLHLLWRSKLLVASALPSMVCGVRSGKTHWAKAKLAALGRDVESLYACYSMTLALHVTSGLRAAPAMVGTGLSGSQFDVAMLDDLIRSPDQDTEARAHLACDWVEQSVLTKLAADASVTWIVTPMARVGLASVALKRFADIASFEFGLPDTESEFPAMRPPRGLKYAPIDNRTFSPR